MYKLEGEMLQEVVQHPQQATEHGLANLMRLCSFICPRLLLVLS